MAVRNAKCDICGENIPLAVPRRHPETGVDWIICEGCFNPKGHFFAGHSGPWGDGTDPSFENVERYYEDTNY